MIRLFVFIFAKFLQKSEEIIAKGIFVESGNGIGLFGHCKHLRF
jgi:hypothetical protein